MEKVIRVCRKPFCKAHFEVDKIDSEEISYPEFCPKCVGNERNVSWEDKKYEGERWDGTPHEFSYKIKKYY
jgi:hypothetical protein